MEDQAHSSEGSAVRKSNTALNDDAGEHRLKAGSKGGSKLGSRNLLSSDTDAPPRSSDAGGRPSASINPNGPPDEHSAPPSTSTDSQHPPETPLTAESFHPDAPEIEEHLFHESDLSRSMGALAHEAIDEIQDFSSTDNIADSERLYDDTFASAVGGFEDSEASETTRMLKSPVPTETAQAFRFMNVDYEADPDTPVISIVTRLSRSQSANVAKGSVLSLVEDEEGKEDGCVKVELLRATSPTSAMVVEREGEEGGGGEEGEEGGKDDAGGGEKDKDGVEVVQEVDREVVILAIRQAMEMREKLKAKNTTLQNKLGEYFKRKRTDENREGEKSVTDQEQRYAQCLSALNDLRSEHEILSSTNQRIANEYNQKLEERLAEATQKAMEFSKYKRSIALAAENSRTGKPIPAKVVDALEATDMRKEAEVVAVRLENIKLRNKLKRHEQLLRQKEELADGLHLIDFEQLKIENQTYNEKIEERNEELLKLRKKITNIVQVLTHVKEKLQFVQGETVDLKRELRTLDTDVSTRRDHLPQSKLERDAYRTSNLDLRQRNGMLGNVPLLRDFEQKV
ncbi:hypothetical protein BJ742DRAFT_116273, partial [Cladochytrium replicatum]